MSWHLYTGRDHLRSGSVAGWIKLFLTHTLAGIITHRKRLVTERRAASSAKPVCHMACACKSPKCPLSSQSRSFPLLCRGSSFPLLPLLLADKTKDDSFTLWTGLPSSGRRHTQSSSFMQNTQGHHTVLIAGWGWLTAWNGRINGYLYFIMFLNCPQNNASLSGRYWNICQLLSTCRYDSISL